MPVFNWAKTFGSATSDEGDSIVVDSSGNIFTVGKFTGTNIDFDTTAGTDLHSSNGSGLFL